MAGRPVQNIRPTGDVNCNHCVSNVSYLLVRKGYGSHLAKTNQSGQHSTDWSVNVLDLLLLVTWPNPMPWNMA